MSEHDLLAVPGYVPPQPPPATPVPAPTASTTQPSPPTGELATTGSDPVGAFMVGIYLVLLGAMVVALATWAIRRRRRR